MCPGIGSRARSDGRLPRTARAEEALVMGEWLCRNTAPVLWQEVAMGSRWPRLRPVLSQVTVPVPARLWAMGG